MWVSIYDPFVSNLGIVGCLNQSDYRWIIHYTLQFLLHAFISPVCMKFSPSLINTNIDMKDILQTWPRWTHQREIYTYNIALLTANVAAAF